MFEGPQRSVQSRLDVTALLWCQETSQFCGWMQWNLEVLWISVWDLESDTDRSWTAAVWGGGELLAGGEKEWRGRRGRAAGLVWDGVMVGEGVDGSLSGL